MDKVKQVSVIIPSYNGAARLPVLLESILLQSLLPHEVIIVLDGSSDNSEDVVFPYAARLPIKLVRQENKGRSAARNAGLVNSRGDIIIFLDDDMKLMEDCLEQHVDTINVVGNAIVVGTQYEVFNEGDDAFSYYKYLLSKGWERNILSFPQDLSFSQLYISTSNCCCTKEVVNHIGGFDNDLKDGEDFAWGFKAKVKGIKIYYQPKAGAYHCHDLNSFERFIKRSRDYFYSDMVMLEKIKKKYPEEFSTVQHPRLKRSADSLGIKLYIKKVLYWPFSFRFWLAFFNSSMFEKIIYRFPSYSKKLVDKVAAAFILYPSRQV